MNGILNVLKPPGMTSFDVVAYLRRVLHVKKVGHTGTLDPGAVGVLPVCIGTATKAIEYMTENDKIYRAEMTLGVSTDTQDSSGNITETRQVNITESRIHEVINSFTGKILQIPPMYSAVRYKGKKLYELARSGITVERKAREIEIYSIDIVDIYDERKVLFDVSCSKGTYIRTLCNDIGDSLGCGGHMSFLIRLGAGIFDINSACTLEDIVRFADNGKIDQVIISTDKVFQSFGKILLTTAEVMRLMNGGYIPIDNTTFEKGHQVRVYDKNTGSFIALGEITGRQGGLSLKAKKVFWRGENYGRNLQQ